MNREIKCKCGNVADFITKSTMKGNTLRASELLKKMPEEATTYEENTCLLCMFDKLSLPRAH